ncbi:MAG: porin [Thiogranum sp.]|nr:porin [Thiogranum sp.]
MRMNQVALSVCLAAGVSASAHAANWLALQGTEPAGSADRAVLWGFVQPEYTYTENTTLEAGPFAGQDAIFNQAAPARDSSNTFLLRRARIGVRGTNFPLDSKTNYFFLVEAGNNGITHFDSSVAMTDASITLSHIPHARIRAGQFKYPGSEEGLQAIHVFDYINFTSVTDQLLLERFVDEDGSRAGDSNDLNGSVGAFRDIGVQVFDIKRYGDWEHSYALMVGNGNGLNRNDNNNDKDLYYYWSSELVFGGAGARREGWKMFAWHHTGERTLDFVNGVAGEQDFDRDRSGIGTTFRKGRYRAAAEYIDADGMIFNGSDGGAVPGSVGTNNPAIVASFNMAPEGEAEGYYVHLGYAVTPKIEFDLRYDYLARLSDSDAGEREFTNWTLGMQYFFNKKTRVTVNYEIRDLEAPGLASSHPANQIVDGLDDRLGVQLLAIF